MGERLPKKWADPDNSLFGDESILINTGLQPGV